MCKKYSFIAKKDQDGELQVFIGSGLDNHSTIICENESELTNLGRTGASCYECEWVAEEHAEDSDIEIRIPTSVPLATKKYIESWIRSRWNSRKAFAKWALTKLLHEQKDICSVVTDELIAGDTEKQLQFAHALVMAVRNSRPRLAGIGRAYPPEDALNEMDNLARTIGYTLRYNCDISNGVEEHVKPTLETLSLMMRRTMLMRTDLDDIVRKTATIMYPSSSHPDDMALIEKASLIRCTTTALNKLSVRYTYFIEAVARPLHKHLSGQAQAEPHLMFDDAAFIAFSGTNVNNWNNLEQSVERVDVRIIDDERIKWLANEVAVIFGLTLPTATQDQESQERGGDECGAS